MNSRLVIISTIFITILLATFLFAFELPSGATNKYTADVSVGIDVAYADMETITNLIDEINALH